MRALGNAVCAAPRRLAARRAAKAALDSGLPRADHARSVQSADHDGAPMMAVLGAGDGVSEKTSEVLDPNLNSRAAYIVKRRDSICSTNLP
jgi:hypothetical protein